MNRRGKRHPIYHCWANMKQRCFNKNATHYSYYGGRGITVCDRWLVFSNFMRDMLDTWESGKEIDRIDNNGNYSPENCRWVSVSTNQANKRYFSKIKKLPRGVTHHSKNRYKASIGIYGIRYYISIHNNIEDAKAAFDLVHREWYGF